MYTMIIKRLILANQRDTAEEQAQRLHAAKVRDQVRRETDERFPQITPENIHQALAFQERRFKELSK